MNYNTPRKQLSCFIKIIRIVCAAVLLSSGEIGLGEVVLDGSLGPAVSLEGPGYAITADLGTQVGNNLFHSFQSFSINSGETALFTGVESATPINRIISRITGGNPSNIDGLIKSDIPNADLFLLNPSGLLFGPNAAVDIQGSFYISTADYIRLHDDGYFNTHFENSENLLTTGKPESFGFLNSKQPSDIQFDGSSLINQEGAIFSVISGDIAFMDSAELISSQGSLNLVSVASAGEVRLGHDEIDTSTFSQMGNISLCRLASEQPGGFGNILTGNRVVIRGGQLVIDNGIVAIVGSEDNTQTTIDNQAIDIKLTDSLIMRSDLSQIEALESGKGITITTPRLQLDEGAQIVTFSDDPVKPSHIGIDAEAIQIGGVADFLNVQGSRIVAEGGSDISISTKHLQAIDGGKIETIGGDISVKANTVILDGVDRRVRAEISATTLLTGGSGTIKLETDQLEILHGARITTTTGSGSSGSGGNLQITANNMLLHGVGGDFSSRSSIQAEAQGSGKGGDLELEVADSLTIQDRADISTRTLRSGDGGSIKVEAGHITLKNRGQISARSEENNTALNAGKAGSIALTASALQLSEESSITVATELANAGNIEITTDFLNLEGQSQITTSVAGGRGTGGNINIDPHEPAPNLLILRDASQIIANALEGNAGNIDIEISEGGALIQSSNSLIEASSKSGLGIDGNIDIKAPDIDIASRFKALPARITDVSTVLKEACSAPGNRKSTFVNLGHGGLPESPEQAGTVALDSERLYRILAPIENTQSFSHQTTTQSGVSNKTALADDECL